MKKQELIQKTTQNFSSKKNEEPLLKVPEQHIMIYKNRIQVGFGKSKNYQIRDKIFSLSNIQTNPTLSQISSQSQTLLTLYFSQASDIFFKLKDEQKKIVLLKFAAITNYSENKTKKFQGKLLGTKQASFKQFFTLNISNDLQRRMAHHILKKKLCQSGFQDQYKLLQQIGHGAMAKVYLIERKQDGKKFAAKIISLKTQCQKTYDTFINQTQILRVLSNKHIVELQGVYISQKKQLIAVMEYLNGETLYKELKQGKLLTSLDKFRAAKQITIGLQHLRLKRIVHRDLKLENIMIRLLLNKKQYVITDFGLSNWMGQSKILFQKCGTPGYLAPQILHQKKGVCLLTHATDIFSLGVLFYFIYMQESLFPYDGCAKKLLQRNKKANFSLKQAQKYLHPKQFILLQKTLDVDPESRTTSKQLLQKYFPELQQYLMSKNKDTHKFVKNSQQQQNNKNKKKQLRQYKLLSRNNQNIVSNQNSIIPSYRKKPINVVKSLQKKVQRSKTQASSIETERKKNHAFDTSFTKSKNNIINSARKTILGVVNKISDSFNSLSKNKKQQGKYEQKKQQQGKKVKNQRDVWEQWEKRQKRSDKQRQMQKQKQKEIQMRKQSEKINERDDKKQKKQLNSLRMDEKINKKQHKYIDKLELKIKDKLKLREEMKKYISQ